MRARRKRWLLFGAAALLLLTAVFFFTGPGLFGVHWPTLPSPALPWLGRPPTSPQPFQPVPLPPEYEVTLTLADYPWPLFHHETDRQAFTAADTELPTYEELLTEALAEFQRQHPNIAVEVQWLSFAAAGQAQVGAGARGEPDVLAVWWEGERPASASLVPLAPYVTEEEKEAWDPLAWQLAVGPLRGTDRPTAVEEEASAPPGANNWWIWPRWINYHYWLHNPDFPAGEEGAAAGAEEEPPVFLPGPAPWPLLGELLALPAACCDKGEDEGWPDQSAVAALLAQLTDQLPGPDWQLPTLDAPPAGDTDAAGLDGSFQAGAAVEFLARGEFTQAGGLGPALAAWPFLQPGLTETPPYRLVTPLGGGPVFSLTGYVIPRPQGEPDLQRVQAAVELAKFLARRLSVQPASRLLARPAWRRAQTVWHETTPLPAALVQQMAAEADRAGDGEFRIYRPAFLRPQP